MNRLAQALSIRPGERRMASLVIGIMLFTAMGASLGGTGIEALFFARFGVEYLPYMFVGLGITSMAISFGTTAALGSIPRRILYIAIPLFIAVVLVLARLALFTGLNWLYPVLWLGKEILNSLTSIMIWGIAGVVCDTRQAKRLFPLFNASRILGQVIGGFVTGALVSSIGVENLLLLWAGALLFAFVFSRTLLRDQPTLATTPKSRQKQPPLVQEMQRGFQYVRQSGLMRWISLAAVLFSILYFSIALPFSRAATEQFANEERLAGFLGLFNGLSTAAAFLASLFLANRLFARLGIMLSLLIFPVIYLIGFASLALLPIFAIIISFRFVQMLWLSGIADPAFQTMMNVIPQERRDQVRAFIGGVPEQAGTFLAGAILIIGEQTLAPQQLYLVGLAAAALCTFAIFRARRGYNEALIQALRAGNPHLFYSEEQPFGGFRQDAVAIRAALEGMTDRDPVIRRVSAEILGHLSAPEAQEALIKGLTDWDAIVRATSLRALTQMKATNATQRIVAALKAPEPDVRFEAVTSLAALTTAQADLVDQISPLLDDEDSRVSTRVASILLRIPPPFGRRGHDKALLEKAKSFLRYTAVMGNLTDRQNAVMAMGDWGDSEAFGFLVNELHDRALPVLIRRTILISLANIRAEAAMPHLIDALGYADLTIQKTAADLLAQIGPPAIEPVLAALQNPKLEVGALLALQNLPLPPEKPVEEYAQASVERAVDYDCLMRAAKTLVQNEAVNLLTDSLQKKSNEYGMRALRAVGLLSDRDAMAMAIDILDTHNSVERANVIEALESINRRWRKIIQPLMKLWEEESAPDSQIDWQRLLTDEDPWIRDCAAFAAHTLGEMKMDNIATLSLMERILFFKRVPLFVNLSPGDLKQIAAIAQEESFSDGTTILREGEVGDVMFIILSGEVRVISTKDQQQVEIARRKPGEIVGEMAILSKEPRSATLTAVGNVRTLCIDQKSFEALLRDRPDVSLAVIQVLSERLKEISKKMHN
ncbi:MAG TPA: MFS transporter [Anaerolineales bacterium]|nr:MFS transporter [Anaerolineales bacterium]